MAGKKAGPVPRGDRRALTLRCPREHMDYYDEEARRLGFKTLNEYLVARLAAAHDLEVPTWAQPTAQRDQRQGTLKGLAIGA